MSGLQAGQKQDLIRKIFRFRSVAGLLGIIFLAILFSPVRGGEHVFLDPANLTDILRQITEKGILAVGMTLVILTGGIDLSVGSILAFSATLIAMMLRRWAWPIAPAVLVVMLSSLSLGAISGMITAKGRIQPFIVTLAMMSGARGLAKLLSNNSNVDIGFGRNDAVARFMETISNKSFVIPAFLMIVIAMHLVLRKTRFGRYAIGIGSNEEAARLSGISVNRIKICVYSISGLLCGIAGIIHCAQNNQGSPNDGVGYELDAIAAVVIGGTSLMGGQGGVIGTLIGALIMGIITNIMGLRNVDPNVQLILKGVIIVAAVLLQRKKSRGG